MVREKANTRSLVLPALAAVTGSLWLIQAAFAVEPLGTPDPDLIEYPDGRPPSEAEIELGRQLFFEPQLSANGAVSCASCHDPEKGLGDAQATSVGASGARLRRNTPPLFNLAWNVVFGWDGASRSLDEQSLRPIMNPDEMGMSVAEMTGRLQGLADYPERFRETFGDSRISVERAASALAAFQRTLISMDSPFDRFVRGEAVAMPEAAVRGMKLFEGKANCARCHDGPNLTDQSFHNIGVDSDDPGRETVDPGSGLQGAFKTPGLRNVALTAPYMHDGSLETLEEVIRFYNRGGDRKAHLSSLIEPLDLSDAEMRDLVAFLHALTDPIEIRPPD